MNRLPGPARCARDDLAVDELPADTRIHKISADFLFKDRGVWSAFDWDAALLVSTHQASMNCLDDVVDTKPGGLIEHFGR